MLADFALSEEQGNEIIMAARAHWFEDEAAASVRGRQPRRPPMRTPHNEAVAADIAEAAERAGPERTCVLTRAKGSRDDLIRLALGPDGEVAPDVRARAPGRGAWIAVGRDGARRRQCQGQAQGRAAARVQDASRDRPRRPRRADRGGAAPDGARPPRHGGALGQPHQRLRAGRSRRPRRQGRAADPRRRRRRRRPRQARPGAGG